MTLVRILRHRGTRLPAVSAWLIGGALVGAAANATAEETTIDVRGPLTQRGARDEVAASTAVAGEKLRAAGATSADVLADVPGVQVSRTGSTSDLSTAAIRGATSAQTPVYLAGVRINDDLTGTADLSMIPLSFVRRVEVYRGSSPMDLDRTGIGGAVLFEPLLNAKTGGSAGLNIGSFGERGAFAMGNISQAKGGSNVMISHDAAQNDYAFIGPNGDSLRRANSDSETTSLWVSTRIQLARRLRAVGILHGYHREQGTPGLAALPDDQARARAARLLAAINLHIGCGSDAESADCSIELITSALHSSTALNDPLQEVIPAAMAWATGGRLEQSARLTKRLSGVLSVTPSLSVATERIRTGSLTHDGVRASRLLVRPALAGKVTFGASTIIVAAVGLEGDSSERPGAQSGAHVFAPSVRLGVKSALVEWLELRANVGHYSRTPTLGELYGIGAGVHGNATLQVERGPTADVGLQLKSHAPGIRLSAEVFAFARVVSELIAYRQSGPAAIAPYNVGRARVMGLESNAAMELFDFISVNGTLTLTDPRNTTADRGERNDLLPYRSRLVALGEAELFARDLAKPIRRAALGARCMHRASKYADSAGLLVVPAQTVVDVQAGAILRDSLLAVRLSLRNVLNAAEFDSIGAPLSGRSIHLSVEGRIE